VKIIDLWQYEDDSAEEIRKEIAIMSAADHPNIIQYHVSFVVKAEVWLVMPCMGASSVAEVLSTHIGGVKDELVIATIMKETLKGLVYFHQNGQIHWDLKSGNILLDSDGGIYLGDFGVSAQLKKGKKRTTLCGSPCWMAPEIIEQEHGYDFSVDIWSLGITAIEIAEGEAPYIGMTAMKIMLAIMKSAPPSLNRSNWSSEFNDFVDSCLQKDPSSRPTALDLLKKDRFIASGLDWEYVETYFLAGFPSLENRVDKSLIALGEEWLASRRGNTKTNKKKK
jgi:serine/threonine-protein kinase OSR1/STK39